MRFAIYDDGVFVAELDLTEKPVLDGKPWRKFYAVEKVVPPYDPATHTIEGPAIQQDHVAEIRRYVWTVRAWTAAELDAGKEMQLDAFDALAFKVLFNHENRLRALENKAPATATAFRTALKAML